MSWLGLVLVLVALTASIPACIDQYRRDRAGFFKTLRIAGLYLLYVLAGIAILLCLLPGPRPAASAAAATAFIVGYILYGGLWLTRRVPRYRSLPAFIDRFPGALDYAFWTVLLVSLAAALLA
jgi:Flp pilus assembly protein TadB